MHTNRLGNTRGYECHAKGSRRETKIHEFMYTDTRTRKMKYMIISVISEATIIVKGVQKILEVIPGKHSTDSIQKTAILGTSYTIRKVQQSETWSLSGGNNRWFKVLGRKRFVPRDGDIIIIITTTIIIIIIPPIIIIIIIQAVLDFRTFHFRTTALSYIVNSHPLIRLS